MALTGQGPPSAALAEALAAAGLAQTQPERARRMAESAATAAAGDVEVRSVVERALGMILAATGDLDGGIARLRKAAELADAASLTARSVEARGMLAILLVLTGDTRNALRELDQGEATVPEGVSAARLQMQRGLVLSEVGRLTNARASFDQALATLQRAGGEDLLEADTLNNRGIVRISLRDWRGAKSDLLRAETIFARNGHVGRTAMVYHNRGMAETLRGDLPAALAAFDESADRYQQAGLHPGELSVDRAEALLSGRLVAEARRAAELAVVEFTRQRNALDLVHARLLLAEAALLDGDAATAQAQAGRARRSALRQARPGWAARAGYLQLRARWLGGDRSRSSLTAGKRIAAELEQTHWAVQAVDAHLVVARTALSLGLGEDARQELVAARSARRSGPAELRARAWYAEALLRRSDGDRVGAAKAVRAGLAVLDQFQASLGATDMRAHASAHTADLARLGLELAFEAGRAQSIFAAAEQGRAGALRFRPARPPDDEGLVGDLAELREVVTELRSADSSPGPLLARQAAIEGAIRDRARHAAGSGQADRAPTGPQLHAALEGATLVEYLELDGTLHAVTAADGRFTFHRLGSGAAAEESIDALRTGLQFLAHGAGSARSSGAVAEMIETTARDLDAMLLAPVLTGAADRPLVVIPTGALHALPWSALPSCTARAVSVAPSAALWYRAATDSRVDAGPAVLAHGPGLSHASAEVRALARRYPNATTLTGAHARVASLLSALDGAGVAHLAAHGHFRADNPMFSELQFADGPLTVYDLERLAVPPRQVVLASCDSGLAGVRTGDELIGLAAALLAMGSVNLVAAVVPVPDEASRDLMLRFHRHLTAGRTTADALRRSRQEIASTRSADGAAAVAAAGFVCFGAG